jgi:hypothetical protein
MAEEVVIPNVTLRGDDLNFALSPWKAVNNANNLRLLPIFLGLLVFSFMASFMTDPTLLEAIMLFAPILIGWFAFIWFTNAIYLGAYKKAYALTPIGADPCTFTFGVNGMRQTLPRGSTSFSWSAIVDVTEDQRGFRFWFTPFMATFVPSRFIDEASAISLRSLIEDARQRGDIKGA